MTSVLLAVAALLLPAIGFYSGLRWERRRTSQELDQMVSETMKDFWQTHEKDLFAAIATALEAEDDDERRIH